MEKVKVFLHGALGKHFRPEWELKVASPREAVRAINCNTNNMFKMFLLKNKNIFYQVVIGEKSISDVEQIGASMVGATELHIVPHVIGASANTMAIVGGAILLVAGSILTFGGFGAAYVAIGIPLMLGGGMMLAQGVIGLLSPQPKPQEAPKRGGRSFMLDPSINTINNGDPIPVAYGRLIIPGLNIDNRLKTEDYDAD